MKRLKQKSLEREVWKNMRFFWLKGIIDVTQLHDSNPNSNVEDNRSNAPNKLEIRTRLYEKEFIHSIF